MINYPDFVVLRIETTGLWRQFSSCDRSIARTSVDIPFLQKTKSASRPMKSNFVKVSIRQQLALYNYNSILSCRPTAGVHNPPSKSRMRPSGT